MKPFVSNALRQRSNVRDVTFDRVYPDKIRLVSPRFWTPVAVATTAGIWLEELGCEALLDIGSGSGKFCIVASLVAGRACTGVEQRAHLVDAARVAAATYQADCTFIHGLLESVDASRFDAFYCFNPFGENLYERKEQLDDAVELSELRHFHDIAIVERWLQDAAVGTCLFTYHGFGGRIPASFELLRSVAIGSDQLRAWQKKAPGPTSEYFVEVDGAVELCAADAAETT